MRKTDAIPSFCSFKEACSSVCLNFKCSKKDATEYLPGSECLSLQDARKPPEISFFLFMYSKLTIPPSLSLSRSNNFILTISFFLPPDFLLSSSQREISRESPTKQTQAGESNRQEKHAPQRR